MTERDFQTANAPQVTAVLVAWNAGPSLARCVDSLRRSATASTVSLSLVVVDNASTDGCTDSVEFTPHDVHVRNSINVGYGMAAVQGLARSATEWILLVNTDLVVDQGFFPAIQRSLASAPEHVATLVPEMRFADADSTVNSRGLAVDELGVPAEIDAGLSLAAPPTGQDPLGGSSGCCVVRRSALASVGGIEPGYFAYLEDVDLAVRLARAGYTAQYVPDAIATHEGSGVTGAVSPLKAHLVARNRRLLFRVEGPAGFRSRLRRMPVELGHAAVSAVLSSSTAPIRGRVAALGQRRYGRFLRASRAAHDPRDVSLPHVTAEGFAAALRRKRRFATASTGHHSKEGARSRGT